MKRTIICGALLTLTCATLHAQNETATPQDAAAKKPAEQQMPATPQAPAAEPQAPAAEPQAPAAEPQAPAAEPQAPATEPQAPAAEPQAPAAEPQAPAAEPQAPATEPQAPATEQKQSEAQPAQPPVVNCDYKIPAETKTIDNALILDWAQKAAAQSFDFDYDSLDKQVQSLQACYTTQGWKGFNTAIEKSGNLKAIKEQKLKVISQIDGKADLTQVKDNQWKVSMPIQVVYQNDKEKLTQLLTVTLNIGRKKTGELGIMQLIAVPRQKATMAPQEPQANQNEASKTETQ